jgi:hypothetical protein
MAKGTKKVTITTPRGAVKYPWLNDADIKFGDPTYKADLLVDAGTAGTTTEAIDAAMSDALAYFTENADEDILEVFSDEPPYFEDTDGVMCFRAKLNKFGKDKKTGKEWENKIAFFDAARKPIPASKVPKVGNGSILRLSVELRPWAMTDVEGRGRAQKKRLRVGVKLHLKGVQVIEVNSGGVAATADSMGFGAEEDGYEYDESAEYEAAESMQGGMDEESNGAEPTGDALVDF